MTDLSYPQTPKQQPNTNTPKTKLYDMQEVPKIHWNKFPSMSRTDTGEQDSKPKPSTSRRPSYMRYIEFA